MFFLKRPTPQVIEQVVADSRDLPLSYEPVGLATRAPASFDVDETIAVIGKGPEDFERACAALASWKQFDLGWTQVFPVNAPLYPGTVVVVLMRHLGFWSLNGCRVVYSVGEGDPDCFGFAYGTLSNHSELGEEIFEVRLHRDSGDVTYRIRAASQPRAPLARLGYPIARWLQACFRRESAKRMTKACTTLEA